MDIHITITAPDLAAAINALAAALTRCEIVEVAQTGKDAPQPSVDVAPEQKAPEAAKKATRKKGKAVDPLPVVPEPDTAEPAASVEPSEPERTYTLDEIGRAGAALVDELGKIEELCYLLKTEFGVQAITQVPPERYGELAAGLRALGAKI